MFKKLIIIPALALAGCTSVPVSNVSQTINNVQPVADEVYSCTAELTKAGTLVETSQGRTVLIADYGQWFTISKRNLDVVATSPILTESKKGILMGWSGKDLFAKGTGKFTGFYSVTRWPTQDMPLSITYNCR